MTFTSFNFLIFFPLVVLIYNIVPQKGKNIFLLLVSYLFYINMQPVYALLLFGVTLITYYGAKYLTSTQSEKKRKRILILSIILIILPLFFFKYFNFINENINILLGTLGIGFNLPIIKLLLPVGISFYTFMSIGYLIDINNEDVEFESSIINTSLFLSFFPIVLSGPIERAPNIFPQLKKLKNSTIDDIINGGKIILWGYFMKLCVADRLATYVDAIFNNIEMHNGTSIAIASLLYPIQIYADLGGYSLIAIGVSCCIGIKIIPNFRRPLLATSMSDLWRRWHMSLIQWITDYVYTPVAFSLRNWKIWGTISAIMIAFLISGIWHGASMTFIVWGLIQGTYLSIEATTQKLKSQTEKKYNLRKKWWYLFLSNILIFIFFAFSEIFARCATVNEAVNAITKIFSDLNTPFISPMAMLFGFISTLILFVKDVIDEYHPSIKLLNSNNKILSAIVAALLCIYILLFGVLDNSQFIYFQF